jgi:hypothetical protein
MLIAIPRDEDTARTAVDMRKEMRSGSYCRGIDHGHQLFEVRAQNLVEEHLITVLQQPEIDVPADGILVETDGVVSPVRLHLDIVVLRRQHAFDTEAATLLRSEGDTLVVDR